MMNIKRIDASTLAAPEILSLLEIARGFSAVRPDWNHLRRKLECSEAWCFFEGDAMAGFALLKCPCTYAGCAAELAALHYRWEYGDEASILRILEALTVPYRGRARYLLLDVNRRHDLNLELYRRFGFRDSAMRSPHGKENIVLIADLTVV